MAAKNLNQMIDSSNSSDLIPDRKLITQLKFACQNLLWFSEAEYPVKTLYWQDVEHFETNYLLQRHNYDAETKIAIKEFPNFFNSVTKLESWHNEAEQSEIRRYQKLKDLLAENLTDLQVYLLGEIEIDVYVLGKTPHQAIAGINTKIVRT